MRFEPTTIEDISKLSEWIQNDPYHKDHLDPFWWLTGQGFLSYKVVDDEGTTLFMRTDAESRLRLHTQFAPESEVSKKRTVASLLWGLPAMISLARQNGLPGLVFESTSPSLIEFMERQGFHSIGNNDHELLLERSENVRVK